MTTNKSIFGLRFRSQAEIHPSQEELRVFLESVKKKGGQEIHGNDLAKYRELLKDMQQDIRDKMFYGVLNHSRFVNPALKSAVEQYKYHLHTLINLDLKKPKVFIRRWAALAEELINIALYVRDNLVKIAKLCEASIVILLTSRSTGSLKTSCSRRLKHTSRSISRIPCATVRSTSNTSKQLKKTSACSRRRYRPS
jgi:hypothetical protein